MATETSEEREVRRHALAREKGDVRININNLVATVTLGVLCLLIGSNSDRSSWSLAQLAIAAPCLLMSSLAYSKLRYRKFAEYETWDRFGWVTHSIGYVATLNAIAVMLHEAGHAPVAAIFMGTAIVLFVVYSALDAKEGSHRRREKSLKLAFYLLLVAGGYLIPTILHAV